MAAKMAATLDFTKKIEIIRNFEVTTFQKDFPFNRKPVMC